MRKIGDNMKLSDKKIVITGSLRPMTREEVILFLKEQGATVQGFISDQTNILIVGHKQL
ncbi:BRCA1 protein, partial [human gut metagenome]